ncbi:MAG: FG-GAP-like repeat-containing protein, partial [bacterium]
MTFLTRFALWLYPRLLRLYPRRFREEFAEEMADVFQERVQDAAADGQWRAVLAVLGRELRDWPLNCLREHWRERRGHAPGEPQFSAVSGWGAVAAGVPYLFYLLSFFGFGMGISPAVPFLFLGAGVLVAWARGWPGWVVSWLGLLILFGQNWLPYRLLTGEPAWNSVSRLLNMLSEVAIQAGWLVVLYLVVRRWPRYGALVFLPFLWMPWAFNMEFASEAMTALVVNAGFLVLALTAVAISAQRSASGDVWLLFGGALFFGISQTLGAVFFSPGMENAWRSLGSNLLQALAAPAGILLLYALNAWAREQGGAVRWSARLASAGVLLSYAALLALGRLAGPSDLEAFQLRLSPVLAGAWLVGALLVLAGAWRLRAHFGGRRSGALVVSTVLLVLLPLLSQRAFLSHTLGSLTYGRPALSHLRDLLPTLQMVDGVLSVAGFGALLLMPLAIGHLRRATDAFPTPAADGGIKAWWRERLARRREQREADGRRLRLSRRLGLLLALAIILVGGGVFFTTAFLPLQLEAEPYTREVALGDVDGDGDLDAILANTMRLLPTADNKFLINDGSGRFSDSGLPVGHGGTGVALLDVDGDGDLDVVIGGMIGGAVYLNNGSHFAPSHITVLRTPESGASQWYLAVGDLNGDGLDDLFMAGCCGTGASRGPGEIESFAPANRVLLSSGDRLVDSGQALGTRGSQAVALGDVDGDGDLDAFVGNTQSSEETFVNDEPNEVWLNDGQGTFSDSGQLLGGQRTYAVALGDVDGDGDLDALVGNEGADELWLNDGQGQFRLGEQTWSDRRTLSVFLADLDGDGDLDALTGHELSSGFAWWRQALLWWNEGNGVFKREDQGIRFRPNAALAV